MMAASAHETNIRCSAEAAKAFVDWYYHQLNESKPFAHGYVNNNATYTQAGHPPADICVNGLVVSSPQEWEKLLEQQRQCPRQTDPNKKLVRYDVAGFDAHVLNADYRFAAPQKMLDIHSPADGVRMMVMVTVSGTVYFGTGRNKGDDYFTKERFQDVFILVPNWDVLSKAGPKIGRRYLVVSHNYRTF